MITDLNLATYPFRNRVLPYLLSAVMLVFAGFGLILCLAWLRQNSNENKTYTADIATKQAEIARLKGLADQVQQQLTPDQKAILTAAHKLVDNKKFGWSRLFADLESVLPGSVSASRISIQNVFIDNGQVKAELELGVISRDFASVNTMMDNMRNSGLFQAELRGQDLQKNERVSYSEYTLRLVYTPEGSYTTAPPGDVAENTTGGGQ